jgi:AraC-like DNA-binding protein
MHEMILVLRGEQYALIKGKRFHAVAGDILFFPAHIAHEEWSSRLVDTYFMSFEWPDSPMGDTPIHVKDYKGRIRVLMEWTMSETHIHTPLTPELHRGLLHALLTQFLRLWMYTEDDFIERIRQFMEKHISEPVRLEDIAKQAGMSKFHFVRKYRRLTGRTPMQDIRILRLERARQLALGTSLPLKEIAEKVGLTDVYYMSRLFRRYFSISPGSLRRAH